jgi:hypothetical protein
MGDRYSPSSDFLCAVANDEVPLAGSAFAEANLARLIQLMSDDDVANRDWATFLLGQLELDRPDVRQALTVAADDREGIVRAEAILGLAQLDRALALPFIRRELGKDVAWVPIFEAATIVADPSLIESLEVFAEPSGEGFLDERAIEALNACRAAT